MADRLGVRLSTVVAAGTVVGGNSADVVPIRLRMKS
jgi:hypothetical protein